jgi:hypothetical protein
VRVTNDHGGIDAAFRFIPDDGSAPVPIVIHDVSMSPTLLGDYARGEMIGEHVTIKVGVDNMKEAQQTFERINAHEKVLRAAMYKETADLASDAGWAWTADYTLVKAAPGLTR